MTKTNEHLTNTESPEVFNSGGENSAFLGENHTFSTKKNHSRRWKHTKPDLKVFCFIGNEKLAIKYNLPLKQYSQKNNWGYWTGKEADQKKYICNSCLKKILLGRFDDWGIGAEKSRVFHAYLSQNKFENNTI